MKILHVAMIAAGLTAAGVGTAAAENQSTERERLEMLWVATGDPTYAHLIRQMDQQTEIPANNFE